MSQIGHHVDADHSLHGLRSLLAPLLLGLSMPVADGAGGEGALVASGWVDESAPYPSCHASTLAEVTPEHLVAAWFAGTHERHPDVCIWTAHRRDGRWGDPVMVADGVQPDGTRLPTWNPVLFQPPGGVLWLFYNVGPNPREWWGEAKTSGDGGKTWSEARRLPEGILGPIKNKPVVLPDGTWLSPSSTEGNPDGWRVHFEVSRDHGATWERTGMPGKGAGFDAIQPSVLFHSDGKLEALCRTKQGVVAMTWSDDGGRSWSDLAATTLPNPNSGTDAVTLADGRQLIVYNPTAHRPDHSGKGNRYPLAVALSPDGLDWHPVLTLESEPCDAGYAYPAVIQAADGRVHISYTWDRKRIKHVVLDPAELER